MGVDGGRGARGRVVMLVDNAVNVDSRVQKTARSAAETGWDVTLLGRSPSDEPRNWQLGGAQVRLLPMGGPGASGQVRRRSRAALLALVGRFSRPLELAYTRFWTTVVGDRAWRQLEPELWDYERAYGPVIDELMPDLIHANDFRMLGVAARAVSRARAQAGRSSWCGTRTSSYRASSRGGTTCGGYPRIRRTSGNTPRTRTPW